MAMALFANLLSMISDVCILFKETAVVHSRTCGAGDVHDERVRQQRFEVGIGQQRGSRPHRPPLLQVQRQHRGPHLRADWRTLRRPVTVCNNNGDACQVVST